MDNPARDNTPSFSKSRTPKKQLTLDSNTDAPIFPEWLGDRAFSATHGSRFNYVVGEMARGIATPRMVIAAVEAGCVGFYGSAGLPLDEVRAGLTEIKSKLATGQTNWGANLIHSPQNPGLEDATIDLFLDQDVRRVSASAFMQLSPEIVRYAAHGMTRNAAGTLVRKTHVFAKVSRAEIAAAFMAPPPDALLTHLVASGKITQDEASLAALHPVALDVTAEADSGGHTDNRAAAPLFASISTICDHISAEHNLNRNAFRIGLAGGIATPHGVAAAFAMGAAYVLTGSVNQCTSESGLSPAARTLLHQAGPVDVMMAPAADMFEQGVEVQVLKRGTLFPMRAKRLHALYHSGTTIDALSAKDRNFIETCLGESIDAAWLATADYLRAHNPSLLHRAEEDGNKRLALIARRYLFNAAQWARDGTPGKQIDYQIWCGPAMGAFNEWTEGSCLEAPENRTVKQIAWNLLDGAAQLTRLAQSRASGHAVAPSAFSITPQLFA